MIKNFTVKVKEITQGEKGIINYYKYLKNENHKNHKEKTQKILKINDSNFLENCIISNKKNDLKNSLNKKGGKPIQNFSKSICFCFPRDLSKDLTDEQIKKISVAIFKDLSKFLNIELTELQKYVFVNRHIEEKTHINFVISNSINEKRLRELKNKNFLTVMKKSFNLHIDSVLNVKHTEYEPRQQKEKKTPTVFLNRLKKSIKEDIQKEFNLKQKEIDVLVKRFFNYLNKYENQLKENKKIESQMTMKHIRETIQKVQIKEIRTEMENYFSPSM